MKARYLLVVCVLATGCWMRAEPQNSPAPAVPATFESREAAAKYVRGLFAGGAVDTLSTGKKEVLIVYVYGSGVPDIEIAAYRFSEGKWFLAKEWRPPTIEIHNVAESDGAIVVIGKKTGQKWVLLKKDE